MSREPAGAARRFSRPAPAKVNLYLKVLGRRPDGYHELDSVMARLDLADRLSLEIGGLEDGLESVAGRGGLPPDFDGPGNLALAALRAFRETGDGWPHTGVRIRLEKNIPLGAGLGGGSSDCAAVLAILNGLAPAPRPAEALGELARSLGADVPFFLQPRVVARAGGVGEKLSEAPPEYAAWAGRVLILVNPGVPVATGGVFKNLGLTNPPPDNNLGPVRLPEPGENDLLRPACLVAPEIAAAAESIESLKPVHWGLSGSGATFWLLSEAPGRDLARLQSRHPDWWIKRQGIALHPRMLRIRPL